MAKLDSDKRFATLGNFASDSGKGGGPVAEDLNLVVDIISLLISQMAGCDAHPLATNVPVVAPFLAVLKHGVPAAMDAMFPETLDPQKPLPQPPLAVLVL